MSFLKRFIDAALILHLVADFLYSPYMALFVMRPPNGRIGPLHTMAAEVPYELILARRLYTIEMWLAFIGLVLYLRFRRYIWGFPEKNASRE